MFRTAAALIVLSFFGTPAAAQSGYAVIAVGADLSRFNRAEFDGVQGLEVDGEVFAAAVRAGASIGASWGVELEFVRPALRVVERTLDSPLVDHPGFPAPRVSGYFAVFAGGRPQYRVQVRRRNTTLAALAWVRQDLTARVALSYLGGLAFHRFTQEGTVELLPPVRLIAGGISRSPGSLAFSMGPVVGVEARIGLTERVLLVPGVRLHGFREGWIFRSNVGVGWSF